MRVVLKIGSGVLADPQSAQLDTPTIAGLVSAIAALQNANHEPIVVSSGAVAAGLRALGLDSRPGETHELQACAAVGQCHLMHHYETAFREHGLSVAQLLLTHDDLEQPDRSDRIMATLETLIGHGGVIPIINENDSVAVEELRYGDNDALASRVAVLTKADFLLVLTTVDGLLDPTNGDALIPKVDDIAAAKSKVQAGSGPLSVGGMASKLDSVSYAVKAGIAAAIANGHHPSQILDILEGGGQCTHFAPSKTPLK